MQTKNFDLTLTPKQGEAFLLLTSPEDIELMYGGGKGGGKTVGGCKWIFYYAKWLMQFFGLKKSDNPPVVGFIGRKQAVDFSTTTLNTFKRDIPSQAYEIKEQKKLIVFENTVAVQFGGLDDSETIQKFNSAEYAFVWIDQPDECTQHDIGMLRATLRLKINGKQPPYKMLLTPNPVISDDPDLQWLREQFVDNPIPKRKFIPALYRDNPHLPEGYGKTLEDAYGFNPALLAAYRDGDWSQVGAADVVIPRSLVMQCVDNKRPWHDRFVRRFTVCDVASSGNDETVIYNFANLTRQSQEIYSHKDLMDTVGRLQAHQRTNKSTMIAVDKVGEGSGVYSRLCEIYFGDPVVKIYGFDSRISAPDGIDDETYGNYRAYAWFNAAKKFFKEGLANVPNDPILISQLSSAKWKFRNGKQWLIGKDEMVDSPDRADAFIMAIDTLEKVLPIDTWNKENSVNRGAWVHPRFRDGMNFWNKKRNPYEGVAVPG